MLSPKNNIEPQLSNEDRKKLAGIVSQMEKNKEPEVAITAVVSEFKTKYGVKKKSIQEEVGSQELQNGGVNQAQVQSPSELALSQSLSKGQDLLKSTGKGFGGIAVPESGIQWLPVSGQQAPRLSDMMAPKSVPQGTNFFSQVTVPVPPVDYSMQKKMAEENIQGNIDQMNLELSYAKNDEQRNEIRSKFNPLISKEQDKLLATKQNQSASTELFAKSLAAPKKEELKSRGPLTDEESQKAMLELQQKPEDKIIESLSISKAMADSFSDDIELIDKFRNVVDLDADTWAKNYSGDLSDSDLSDIKEFQIYAKKKIDSLKSGGSIYDVSNELNNEFERLNSKIESSSFDKKVKYISALKDESIDDYIYDRQKDVAENLISNLPSDMQERVKANWDRTSKMRDFMAQYYDPSGRNGFTIDPEGNVKVSGIKDPKLIEYITNSVNSFISENENAKKKEYTIYTDTLIDKLDSADRMLKNIKAAQKKLKELDKSDPNYLKYRSAIEGEIMKYGSSMDEIKELKKSQSQFFLSEPKEVLNGISKEMMDSESARAAFSSKIKGDSPLQSFQKSYLSLLEKTESMRDSGSFDSGKMDQLGQNVRDWLDIEFLGVSLTKEEKEYLANRRMLNSLAPIFLNNDLSITEDSGDFFEGFMSGASSFITPTSGKAKTQTSVASDQLRYISENGFSSDDMTVKGSVKEIEDRIEDIPWDSMESIGETTGVVAAVIADVVIADAVLMNPALNLASKSKRLASIGKAYDKTMDASRIGRYLKSPIGEGIKYEVAGELFGSAEDELNFASGFVGTLAGNSVKTVLSKLPVTKQIEYISNIFGSGADDAMAVFKKIGDINARGIGEIGEEFSQELVQIYNDELRQRGFWDEVSNRFGDFDDNMKFFLSSYIMGSGFGFAKSSNSDQLYDSFTEDQKAAVDSVKDELLTAITSATKEAVVEAEKIKKADSIGEESKIEEAVTPTEKISEDKVLITNEQEADIEYKVDDAFYSEQEFLDKLSDPEFVTSVNSGSSKVNISNPSVEVIEKLKGIEPSILKDSEVDIKIEKPVIEGGQMTINFDEISDDVNAITGGKTTAEIAREANISDSETSESIDDQIKLSFDMVPEGQSAIANKDFYESILLSARQISNEENLSGSKLIDSLAEKISSITDGAVSVDEINEISKELLSDISPKKSVVSGKSTQKLTKDKFEKVALAIELISDRLAADMSTLKSSPLPIVQTVVAGAMNVAAKTVRLSGDVAQAITDAVDHVKKSDWYNGLSENGKAAAEKIVAASVQQTVDAESKSVIDSTEKKVTTKNNLAGKERSFSKRMSEDVVKGLSKNAKRYIPTSDTLNVKEANEIINKKGDDQAMRDVLNFKNKMSPKSRVAIGVQLIKKFESENNPESLDKAVEIANELSQYATVLGQAVQAFSLWDKVSATGMIVGYEKNLDKARGKLKQNQEFFYSGTKEGYKSGTKKAAKKAVNTVFGKNTPKTKKAKAFGLSDSEIKQKKNEALSRLKSAIKKGGGLTSGGLNVDAIEALAEYGFYAFADGLRTFSSWVKEMKSATGVNDDDLLYDIWNNKKGSSGKTLKELSDISSIEEISSNHFVNSDNVNELSEKLMESFGIDEDLALGLANELTQEFNRIVKQERESAIKKNTKSITKKKRNAIDSMSSKNNLSDGEIENEIELAFGIKELNEDQKQEIKTIIDERDARPEGFLRDEMTREALSKFESYNGISKSDILWSMWYASVLSGYETQMLNVGANAINIMMEGFVSSIESAVFNKDPKAIIDSMNGMIKGMKEGSLEFNQVLSKGYSPEKLSAKLEVKDTLENIDFKGGKLNPFNYYKYVGRFMTAVDTGSYMAAKGMRKNEEARRVAIEEGLSGKDLSNRVQELIGNSKDDYVSALDQAKSEIQEIVDRGGKISSKEQSRLEKIRANEILEKNTPEEIVEKARNFASFVTYNYEPEGVLGVVASNLSLLGKKFPPFKLIVPFTRVVANVLNQQLDYFPLTGYARAFGVSPSAFLPLISKKTSAKDLQDRNRKLIKATIGTITMVALYAIASMYDDEEDKYIQITGKGPSDFNKRNQLYSQGWKPYSIKIGSKYIGYQYTPMGFALSFIGNWKDNEKYKELGSKDMTTRFAFAVQSSASGVFDMSFLTGISGLMSGLASDGNPDKVSDKLLKSTGKTATSFIPNLFKQIDKIFDPTIYDSKSIKASILKEIPVVKELSDLKPKLNSFGQPVEKTGTKFTSSVTKDPVWLFMAKHEVFASGLSPNTKNYLGKLMSDDEFYDYAKKTGEQAYQYIVDNMEYLDDLFSSLTPSEKKKKIDVIFKNAKSRAKYLIVSNQ